MCAPGGTTHGAMKALLFSWMFLLLFIWQRSGEIEALADAEVFMQKDVSEADTQMVMAYQGNLAAASNGHADSVTVAILMPSPTPSPRPMPSPTPMAMKLTKRPAQRHSGKKSVKHCPCCGGQHSLQQCKLPGAKLIQKLRAMKKAHTDNRKKKKHSPRKSGSFAKSATQQYSQKPKPKDVRHLFQRKKQGAEAAVFEKRLTVADTALEELQKAGFVGKVQVCNHCVHRSLQQEAKPLGDGEDRLYYRCTRKQCEQRTCVLENSPLHDMKISPNLLARSLQYVCRQPWTESVSATDVVSNVVGMGRLQARHVLDALRLAEAKCAQKRQKNMKLSGNLEADATGIRSPVVKRTNPNYKAGFNSGRLMRLTTAPKALLVQGPCLPICSRGGPCHSFFCFEDCARMQSLSMSAGTRRKIITVCGSVCSESAREGVTTS